MKGALYITYMFILLVFMTSCTSSKSPAESLTDVAIDSTSKTDLEVGYEVGNRAFDIEVENFTKDIVKLSDFLGKPVYILAWTSTWGACISELPEIREVRDANLGDFEILIVNLSKYDDINTAKEIITSEQLTNEAYFDVNGHLVDNYNITGIPTSFYIDAYGIIKKVEKGKDNAANILSNINDLIE